MKSSKSWMNLIIATSILILLIVGFLIGRISIKSESEECIANPLSYGVRVLEEVNDNIDFMCSCTTQDLLINPLYFDDEGVYDKNPNSILPA